MPSGKQQTPSGGAARAYSLGFELVCAVAGFVAVGFWIDRHYSSGPWATLICLALGLIGGFYNLIRGVSRLSRESRRGTAEGPVRTPEGKRLVRPAAPEAPEDPRR